jgi:hypothetical protein
MAIIYDPVSSPIVSRRRLIRPIEPPEHFATRRRYAASACTPNGLHCVHTEPIARSNRHRHTVERGSCDPLRRRKGRCHGGDGPGPSVCFLGALAGQRPRPRRQPWLVTVTAALPCAAVCRRIGCPAEDIRTRGHLGQGFTGCGHSVHPRRVSHLGFGAGDPAEVSGGVPATGIHGAGGLPEPDMGTPK